MQRPCAQLVQRPPHLEPWVQRPCAASAAACVQAAVAEALKHDMCLHMGTDKLHHPAVLIITGNIVPQDAEQSCLFVTYVLDATFHHARLVSSAVCLCEGGQNGWRMREPGRPRVAAATLHAH